MIKVLPVQENVGGKAVGTSISTKFILDNLPPAPR